MGYISLIGESYQLKKKHVIFEDGNSHENLMFVQGAISEALRQSSVHFQRSQESFFESTILSVKSADYENTLKSSREEFLKWQASLEAVEADTIIRFNIQIYPCKAPTDYEGTC